MDGGRARLSSAAEGARAFAEREVAPHAASWERERVFPLDALKAAAAAGLTATRMPGRTLVEACQAFEALAAAGRDVEPLLRGDQVGAFCLTEPGAGTDAAAISTAAGRDGEGWRLDGV